MKDNYFSTIEEFKTTLPAKKLMGLAIKELLHRLTRAHSPLSCAMDK